MLDYSKEKESMGEQVDPFDLTKSKKLICNVSVNFA